MRTVTSRTSILFLILLLSCCSGIDSAKNIGQRTMDELLNIEMEELSKVLTIYKANNGHWPSQKTWDSLKHTNSIFNRLSDVTIQINAESISVKCIVNYEESFSSVKTIDMTYTIYESGTSWRYDKIILQGNLDLNKSTHTEIKRQFRKLEQKRKSALELTIQDTKTGDKKRIPIGTIIATYYKDNDSNEGLKRPYFGKLDRINSLDSTINIRLWSTIYNYNKSFARVKISDINSMKLIHGRKADEESYKILEIVK